MASTSTPSACVISAISATVSSSGCLRLPVSTSATRVPSRCQPARASRRATALPMPVPPPVIRATVRLGPWDGSDTGGGGSSSRPGARAEGKSST
eukprot:scaffold5612_cov108-Isochrysis_galbana.AAC.2